jgi:hypothetical protein
MSALEAREPCFLPVLHPPEERLIGLVETGQHVLQHVAVNSRVLRELRADGFQLRFLFKPRDRDVLPLPGDDALL